jgi:death-on-curing protein
VGTPESTFEGEYLQTSIFEMAGAYLFHVLRNHPFVDGNKRTGLMAALVFLGLNGLELSADADDFFDLVDGAAAGEVAKARVAVCLEEWGRRREP